MNISLANNKRIVVNSVSDINFDFMVSNYELTKIDLVNIIGITINRKEEEFIKLRKDTIFVNRSINFCTYDGNSYMFIKGGIIKKLNDSLFSKVLTGEIKLSLKKYKTLLTLMSNTTNSYTSKLMSKFMNQYNIFYIGKCNLFLESDYFLFNNVFSYGTINDNRLISETRFMDEIMKEDHIDLDCNNESSLENLIEIFSKRNFDVAVKLQRIYYYKYILETLTLEDMNSINDLIVKRMKVYYPLFNRIIILGRSEKLNINDNISDVQVFDTWYFICKVLDY